MVRVGNWADWTGFGEGEATTVDIQKDKNGDIVAVITSEPGKTLWDWLSLLGVPLSLAILGFYFQKQEQKRSELREKSEQERTSNEEKEEILQLYYDRLSSLLVDKNILAIAIRTQDNNNQQHQKVSLQEEALLDAAVDIIRARTLSILRRFSDDPRRKTDVIEFLIEAELMSKTRLGLIGADLAEVNLSRANLSGAHLVEADFTGANLSRANLGSANLGSADLAGANLSEANLSSANLSGADLDSANLKGANLNNANLNGTNLSKADLSNANLDNAKLSAANLNNASLSFAYLGKANISFADLIGADLIGANLRDASLNGADLIGANLRNANLSQADLIGANLTETNLSETNLTSADLSGAELNDVNFSFAKLCCTILPTTIEVDGNRDCVRLGIEPE